MQTRWLLLLGALIAGVFFGCGDGEEVDAAGYFDSDVPGFGTPGSGAGGLNGAGGAAGASATGGSGGGGGAGGAGGAEKAIEEADIIQLQGNRLYALSKYGGLSVVDVSVKDQLKLLGRHELSGEPFEMYVKEGIAFAMYSSWGHYVGSGASTQWVQSSAVVALDVKDPKKIVKLGEFLLPGEISDSRIVGDVLYVVAYENGSCWNCASNERTNVVSLNVKVPSKVAKVDELAFGGPSGYYGWGKRSVMVTQDRMFIGGRDPSGAQGSTIQIVDITDPTGKLVKGASVPAAGSIESRWQMDEKDGVLRLISQPGWWATGDPPIVQTFEVVSSQEIKPLASLPMVLPEPERLRSVRFDGTRGYAITFRQTDPLFVIDLSVPSAPKQVGELKIPGWVYHMEPRGDRLLALGFDQGNQEGSLNVSLFDVADMTAPKLMDRVSFGGDWGDFAEDQDRIHKAFTILDTLGLIFVPYSGWTYSKNDYYGCGTWQSGIQIVNFTKDDLVKRGAAPSRGTARRAFLHDTRLFAVSDVAVETFDISNQDAPAAKANLALATVVSKVIAVGDKVARVGSDWYTSRTVLDVVPLGAIDEPGGSAVDLEAALGSAEESKCWYGYWGPGKIELYANGSHVYVVAGYDERRIAVFDVSSGVPVLQSKLVIPALDSSSPYGPYYGYYGSGIIPDAGEATVQLGSALVSLRYASEWLPSSKTPKVSIALDVVDLSNPKSPKRTSVPVPSVLGATSLVAAGGDALFSHWAPSPTDPNKVRFYVDRVDLANPSAPKLSSTNVPGSLLATDSSGKRALTVTYAKVVEQLPPSACYDKWSNLAEYEYDPESWESGTCTGYKRALSLVQLGGATASVLDGLALPGDLELHRFALGTDRVFVGAQPFCSGCYGSEPSQVLVLSGFGAGKIQLAGVTLPEDEPYSFLDTLIADGTRAVAISGYPRRVRVVDAKNAAAPSFATVATLEEQYYYYGYEAQVIGDTLVLPQGPYGVELVDLTP
ncbi:MAG: hypothetical protein AMXMBFR56_67500 [Polyangiaceae bacterium]